MAGKSLRQKVRRRDRPDSYNDLPFAVGPCLENDIVTIRTRKSSENNSSRSRSRTTSSSRCECGAGSENDENSRSAVNTSSDKTKACSCRKNSIRSRRSRTVRTDSDVSANLESPPKIVRRSNECVNLREAPAAPSWLEQFDKSAYGDIATPYYSIEDEYTPPKPIPLPMLLSPRSTITPTVVRREEKCGICTIS